MERPFRWDLLARYRFIEIVAQWEGRLTTNHLCNAFGIGRQQASKDINAYMRDVASKNLNYDKNLKGYVPSVEFKPVLTTGMADEYLHILSRTKDIAHAFDHLDLGFANTEMLQVNLRRVEPAIVRAIVRAAREQKYVELSYTSFTTPEAELRVIAPHTLVCTPMRWHVRAFCEKSGGHRDFVLSRFSGEPMILGASDKSEKDDLTWNKQVTIKLEPDSRFNVAQKAIIEKDFDMKDGRLEVTTRAPLVSYTLRAFNIDYKKHEMKPEAQQIVIANFDEIKNYLY